ncbi:hypothetical protein CARUB_v10003345mg [Capsella rubella]|uniref:Knottin scorpion toxin-like domain-containing protein n=1 Tax=Capsella rubella TaxID=81985 RepID=R0HFU2_9BRAS|nr:hypothetical protein CARUB_v10003345mg [Capsella rubella]
MKKSSQPSATIVVIFTILFIGVMVKETLGQSTCFEVLKDASKGGKCDWELCGSLCNKKSTGGVGTCRPKTLAPNKGQPECHCRFYCGYEN